jgi:phosphoglycerate kinase
VNSVRDPDNLGDGSEPLPAFDTILDLDCRGRRVFFRADPLLLAAAAAPVEVAADTAEPTPSPLDGGAATPRPAAAGAALPGGVARPTPAKAPTPTAVLGSSLALLLEQDARVVIGTSLNAKICAETGLAGIDALAARLTAQLGIEDFVPDDSVGDGVVRVLGQLRPGQIALLPDLALEPGESSNDERFARALASSVDAYVGDAFASSHLEHASLVRLPRLLPRRALGSHARKELAAWGRLLSAPRGTLGFALGAARFADKIDLLEALLPRVKTLGVGGGLALTLLVAAGRAPAEVCAEPERLAQARSLLTRCRDLGVELLLPTDFKVRYPGEREFRLRSPRHLGHGAQVLDLGPESTALYLRALGARKQLFWWDPLGDPSAPDGAESSAGLAELCARQGVHGVVLGSATRQFVRQLPVSIQTGIDLVSSGTRAARLLLSGSRLPGIEALRLRH